MHRHATLRSLEKYGFSPVAFGPDEDFDTVCRGLNLFLCVLGNGVDLKATTSLGSKIRVAETLVLALEECGCNLRLQPHQLTGLDWKAIHNVVE